MDAVVNSDSSRPPLLRSASLNLKLPAGQSRTLLTMCAKRRTIARDSSARVASSILLTTLVSRNVRQRYRATNPSHAFRRYGTPKSRTNEAQERQPVRCLLDDSRAEPYRSKIASGFSKARTPALGGKYTNGSPRNAAGEMLFCFASWLAGSTATNGSEKIVLTCHSPSSGLPSRRMPASRCRFPAPRLPSP